MEQSLSPDILAMLSSPLALENFAKSSPEAREMLERLILSNNPNPPLWSPLPGPQAIAYQHQADVIGYGGAGGGGKSDLALGFAITGHKRSLLLRREQTNASALFDRAREILGMRGRFNESNSTWRNEATGQKIEFRGCVNPGDEQKYRGRPHDLIVFDEADQFPEFMMRFISGWLRTTIVVQRCRLLINFNPPSTADGEWLLQFFGPWISDDHPNPAKPAEIRWFAMVDGKEMERPNGAPFVHQTEIGPETIRPKSRTFIPARLLDNPYLLATNYGSQLQSLPEPLRTQLLYGDMRIGRLDDAWQTIPTAWVKAAQKRWTEKPPQEKCNALGVDVAAGGADQTCIIRRHGNWFSMPKKYKGPITDDGVKAAHLVEKEWQDEAPAHVDAIGYGKDCWTHLRYGPMGKKAIAINVGEGTEEMDRSRKFKFVNVRAAMWFRMREALDPEHGDNLALPPDPELLADLTAPRYEPRASGLQVESKIDIKERIGRSPDVGDALCLALWRPRMFKPDIAWG